MTFLDRLLSILNDPATIHFVPGTDRADFGEIDLTRNPQRTPQGFSWFGPNRANEASVSLVLKIIYDVMGDKSGPYYSLPDEQWLSEITKEEMGKAKAGFACRFVHKDHPDDEDLPEAFFEHNQAAFDFFLTIQEKADERMANTATKNNDPDVIAPALSVKPFVKRTDDNAFYTVPVLSAPLFPQFRGARTPGVLRGRGQTGRLSLNPNSEPHPAGNGDEDPHVFLGELPDPSSRYRALKANQIYRRYEMSVPPVFKANGARVHPSQYRTVIPEGTIVAVRGSMKMYNIPHGNGETVNRPYVFIFDRIQVVGDEMDSRATNPKKRTPPSPVAGSSKKFAPDPGPSKPRPPSDDEDEEL